MPQYFINIRSGEDTIFDGVGSDHSSMKSVHTAMLRRVAKFALSETRLTDPLDWEVEALDERGKIVATMTLDLERR